MATTSTFVSDVLIRNRLNNGITARVITVTYIDQTAGDDVSFTIEGKDYTGQGSTAVLAGTILGWNLHSVHHIPEATGPTDDSDFTIIMGGTQAPDALGGSGTDMFDEAVGRIIYPQDSNSDGAVLVPIIDKLVCSIANNSVNNAAGTIKIVLTMPKGVN